MFLRNDRRAGAVATGGVDDYHHDQFVGHHDFGNEHIHTPGDDPAAYAVYVDEADIVWASDFGANAIVRFDPTTEQFHGYPLPHEPGDVRQVPGRPGEIWGAESAADHLIVIRTR